MPSFRILLFISLALLSTQTLLGCSGKAVDENDPGAVYQDAEDDTKSEHYQMAVEKFKTVKNKFPYSKYAVQAQLRLADVYFLQENFSEAALAYESFNELHPKHEKTGYALYRIGLSHLKDDPGHIGRDQTAALKAMKAFEDYLTRFKSGEYSVDARKYLTEMRKTLSDKELYIANFYIKQDAFDSARDRLEKIISLYPDTEAAKSATEKLPKLPPRSPKKTEEKQP